MQDTTLYLIILVAYLAGMVGIGFFFYAKNTNIADYVLGSRGLGPIASAMSAQASDMSGWLLMGVPGLAYALWEGTAEAVWVVLGLWIGTYLNWLLVARRLRLFTGGLDVITLPDYFAKRFQDKSGVLRVVSAVFILIFFLVYTASMFSAGGKLFHTVFGIDYRIALIGGGAIIVSYTFLGGFLAVCWTDVIQGILMFFALVITPIGAFIYLARNGGVQAAIDHAANGNEFSLFNVGNHGCLAIFILSNVCWGLGYFGQPHILPRFMGIKSPGEIKIARRIAMAWVTITLGTAVLCGVAGAGIFPNLEDPETVFMHTTRQLFPPFIAGILVTAILSAIMSTADSQLLVTSSAAASDLFHRTFYPNASEKSTLWVSRATVITVSILALALVYIENPDPNTILGKLNASIFKLVAFAWAGFGAAFGPLILCSLFWRRTTLIAAIAGILSGGTTTFFWRFLSGGPFGIFDLYEVVPGLVVSLVVIIAATFLQSPNTKLMELFDRLKNGDGTPIGAIGNDGEAGVN